MNMSFSVIVSFLFVSTSFSLLDSSMSFLVRATSSLLKRSRGALFSRSFGGWVNHLALMH